MLQFSEIAGVDPAGKNIELAVWRDLVLGDRLNDRMDRDIIARNMAASSLACVSSTGAIFQGACRCGFMA